MTLKARLQEDMKAAMRARESERLGAIRLLQAAIKQREVDTREEATDGQIVEIVQKLIKQRRDSIAQFRAAGRNELADHEQSEITILEAYMPEPLDDASIDAIVATAIAEVGAKGPADMGKVVARVKAQVAGRADMGEVSGRIKKALSTPA